ncbi:unnamed protein product [Ostreobium quekettii]|uniref:Uncharacterized protein n=1 Tax=Ostreobium quekettii TaxID=121088 RepID=A0A8S1J836_9CHLO|nr:unnamed protein product [Ostreobium quekettii]
MQRHLYEFLGKLDWPLADRPVSPMAMFVEDMANPGASMLRDHPKSSTLPSELISCIAQKVHLPEEEVRARYDQRENVVLWVTRANYEPLERRRRWDALPSEEQQHYEDMHLGLKRQALNAIAEAEAHQMGWKEHSVLATVDAVGDETDRFDILSKLPQGVMLSVLSQLEM